MCKLHLHYILIIISYISKISSFSSETRVRISLRVLLLSKTSSRVLAEVLLLREASERFRAEVSRICETYAWFREEVSHFLEASSWVLPEVLHCCESKSSQKLLNINVIIRSNLFPLHNRGLKLYTRLLQCQIIGVFEARIPIVDLRTCSSVWIRQIIVSKT